MDHDKKLESDHREDFIKNFKLNTIGTKDNSFIDLLMRQTKEAYSNKLFICAVIMAGILSEALHKAKLREKNFKFNSRMSWECLIELTHAKGYINEDVKNLLHKIRKEYRNPWIHIDIDTLRKYAEYPYTDAGLMLAKKAGDDSLNALYDSFKLGSYLFGGNPIPQ